jgi:D-alanine-D-alanine ligase-like ATP-grasp enzyme
MIDEDLRVWLIEINQNPSVVPMSEQHHAYMKTMVHDLFKIVLSPVLDIPCDSA